MKKKKTTKRSRTSSMAKAVEDAAKDTPKKKTKISRSDLLGTGSTLLNLACADSPFGGFLKGKYYYVVGDSSSGKTFLTMTCFAEAMRNKQFKDYRLIYDNVEDGCLMDLQKFFGKKVARRVEAPGKDEDGNPAHSFTIEEFYYNVDDATKTGKPFIYVLDSMDGLSSESEGDKFEQHKDAHRKGKVVPGSYGDGKAKKNSENIRQVINGLRKSGSILIIISQTRDNIGYGFEKKTRSGGRSLRFYACLEIWSSIAGRIKKTIKNKKRTIGVYVKLQGKKNRITGKEREVEIAIYPSYGIDDIGSCVDYLVEHGWWKKKGNLLEAGEFDAVASRNKLVQLIEENEWEKELQYIVGKCWKEMEKACVLARKSRY